MKNEKAAGARSPAARSRKHEFHDGIRIWVGHLKSCLRRLRARPHRPGPRQGLPMRFLRSRTPLRGLPGQRPLGGVKMPSAFPLNAFAQGRRCAGLRAVRVAGGRRCVRPRAMVSPTRTPPYQTIIVSSISPYLARDTGDLSRAETNHEPRSAPSGRSQPIGDRRRSARESWMGFSRSDTGGSP